MKRLNSTAVLIVLVAASISTAFAAGQQNIQQQNVPPMAWGAKNCVPSSSLDTARGVGSTSKPPLFRVCVSDSNAQLNLPWFVTDIINGVDSHESPGTVLHKMGSDF
jgi:hypothetical protein